jgi:hypothetical protein
VIGYGECRRIRYQFQHPKITTAIRAAVADGSRVQAICKLVHQTGLFSHFQDVQSFFLGYPATHSQINIVVGIET